MGTPRDAMAGGDLGDQRPSLSALSRTLSTTLNGTVPTVIAGQVMHIKPGKERRKREREELFHAQYYSTLLIRYSTMSPHRTHITELIIRKEEERSR